MKKFLTVALSLMTATACVAVSGCDLFGGNKDEVTEDGVKYKLTQEDTYAVAGFDKEDDSRESLVIPDTVKDKPVTCINGNSFKNNSKLTSVTIPDSVTAIYSQAFAFCTSLTKVTIGKGLARMGEGVFGKCEKLKSVYISDLAAWCGVDYSTGQENTYYGLSNPLSYGASLYLDNKLLTEVVIPDSVTEVKGFTFAYCTGIESVKLHSKVTKITAAAFTDSTVKSYTVDENNDEFSSRDGILYNRTMTEIIDVPSGFEGDAVIPDSVTKISRYAFGGRNNLTSVTLGSGIVSIDAYAFSDCDKLDFVVVQKGIAEIHCDAFDDDTKIYYTGSKTDFDKIKVTGISTGYVPSSMFDNVTYGYKIGSSTGAGSTGSTGSTGSGSTGNTGSTGSTGNTGSGGNVSVEDLAKFYFEPIRNGGEIVAYEVSGDAPLQLATSVVIPSAYEGKPVTSIAESAFSGYTKLKSVTIPSSITKINKYAFYDSPITSVVFENSQNWYVGNTASNANQVISGIHNYANAAQQLTPTYYDKVWVRK